MAYVTVSGLSSGLYVPISVIGTASNIAIKVTQPTPNTAGISSTSGYTTTLTGWNAQNGTVIDLRATSSSEYATQVYVTLSIGGASSTWYITTQNAPNNAPNPPPSFENLTDQPLNTNVYTTEVYQVAGLSATATASVLGNGGSGTGGNTAKIAKSSTATVDGNGVLSGASFTSSSITVSNGDYIQLRQLTSTANNTSITTTLTIGTGLPVNWSVSTGNPPDSSIDTFNFQNITGATPGQQYSSAVNSNGDLYTVTGVASGVTLNVTLESSKLINSSGVETTPLSPLPRVQINNGSIGTFPATVQLNDTVRIWMYAGSNYGDQTWAQIKVGDYTPQPWKIFNSATPDTTPDTVTFKNRTNRPPSTATNSNAVSITGIQTGVQVTTTNGALISKNGGTYSASPVNVVEGDTISLQLTSSATLGGSVSTTVSIGDLTGITWSVGTWATAPTTELMTGQWYSRLMVINQANDARQEKKEDGLAIGTVLPISRFQDDSFEGASGDLDGTMESRYPGWMECDGRELTVSTYYELWNVIGNTYGGSGAYSSSTNSYSGTFKLPNYRNRKLVGVGPIDGNNASSPSVTTYKGADPSSASTGDANQVGSSGGNWIIDTVDTQGARPPEQVYDGSPTDIDGPFYVLGAIRTTGYSGVTTDVDFVIGNNGYISATVGPLDDVFTKIGQHTHFMLTGQETDEDISFIGWGVPSYGGAGDSGSGSGVDGRWIADRPSPADELYGAPYTSDTVTYGWWWRSPKSNTPVLDNAAGDHLAMIDTSSTNATTDPFDPGAFGGALTHSHYISETAFNDPKTQYGWGNNTGSGTVAGTFPTTYGNTLTVQFNQSQLQITSNTATFTLNSTKQIVPTVNLSPQKKIPIMNKYVRVKYLIKVY
jgi:hypothetical protein